MPRLTQDHAAAAGAAPVEAQDDARGQATRERLRPSNARPRPRGRLRRAAVKRAAAFARGPARLRARYGRAPVASANAKGSSATTFLVSLRALARLTWKPS